MPSTPPPPPTPVPTAHPSRTRHTILPIAIPRGPVRDGAAQHAANVRLYPVLCPYNWQLCWGDCGPTLLERVALWDSLRKLSGKIAGNGGGKGWGRGDGTNCPILPQTLEVPANFCSLQLHWTGQAPWPSGSTTNAPDTDPLKIQGEGWGDAGAGGGCEFWGGIPERKTRRGQRDKEICSRPSAPLGFVAEGVNVFLAQFFWRTKLWEISELMWDVLFTAARRRVRVTALI